MSINNQLANQNVSSTGTPTFATLTLTNPLVIGSGGTGVTNYSPAPNDPNITFSGTWISPAEFTFYNTSGLINGSFVSSQISATYDSGVTESNITSLDLGDVQKFIGTFNQSLSALTTFTATNLVTVTGTFQPVMAAITSLSLNSLVYIGNAFAPNMALLTSFSATGLTHIGGQFSPILASMITFSLNSLLTIGGNVSPSMASLTTLNFPALTTVTGAFGPTLNSLTSIDLSSLQYANGFSPVVNAITTISLPAFVNSNGSIIITANNLVTFSMGSTLLRVNGSFSITNAKLNQASVDGILVSLAALDGTGGTTSYNSQTVNLSGGTSSAPSATGLTAKTTLQGRGCTVTTN